MVEINASKHAYNVPVQQVLECLLRAALEDGLTLNGKDLKLRTKKASLAGSVLIREGSLVRWLCLPSWLRTACKFMPGVEHDRRCFLSFHFASRHA
jgi:hypothetical protein